MLSIRLLLSRELLTNKRRGGRGARGDWDPLVDQRVGHGMLGRSPSRWVYKSRSRRCACRTVKQDLSPAMTHMTPGQLAEIKMDPALQGSALS